MDTDTMDLTFCDEEHGHDGDTVPTSLVEECIMQQMTEIDMLMSIYQSNELLVDPDCVMFLDAYRTDPSCIEHDGSLLKGLLDQGVRLGFTLKLLMNGEPLEVKCDLPQLYPIQKLPNVFVRQAGVTPPTFFRKQLDQYLSSLEVGDAVLFTIFDWISSNISSQQDGSEDKAIKLVDVKLCNFTRMWIYSHHIYSKFKRRDILAWANELNLTGFSMVGKPGVICIEGHTEEVDEFWSRLRRLQWQKLVMKEREDTKDCSTLQFEDLFKFNQFEEKVFCTAGQNTHANIGELRKFLMSHGCADIFVILFGLEVKGS